MDLKTKAILINVTILATLAWKYYTGLPFFIAAISAVILLPVANITMALMAKRNAAARK
ncbi:MAG: hypothetical protein HOQ35_14825 [Acidobacteriaceae bacterium]|nr:hypothetical protein [Acidobacteriaceae bacterium]